MAKLLAWLLLTGSAVAACATNADPPPTTSVAAPRAPASRADLEARAGTPPAAAARAPGDATRLVLRRVAADGVALTTAADAALAVDLDAAAFPARALDPVLLVGDARLTRYRYLPGGVLRFYDDAGALQAGAPVALQYGAEVASRREVRTALVMEVTP